MGVMKIAVQPARPKVSPAPTEECVVVAPAPTPTPKFVVVCGVRFDLQSVFTPNVRTQS